jgi:hypothetical protein
MTHDASTERFPVKGAGETDEEAILIHFGRYISTPDAKREMDELGLCSGAAGEISAFAAAYPEPWDFPIIKLEKVSGRCVACLCGSTGGRCLSLDDASGNWGPDCRFLAFRKSTP